jgi:hypothetical protein
VVLSPAFQALYSPFDAAIGHHRRYTRVTLAQLAAEADLRPVKMFYLDSIGFLASAANRILLRRAMPTLKQIHLWDRAMVPISRLVDPLLLYSFGKTVVGIWQKT